MTFVLRTAWFFAYCALVVAGNLPTLRALFEFSNQNATASYVLLIPLVTLALVYQDRDTIFAEVRIDWPAALPFIVAGAALMVAGGLGQPPMAADLSLRVAAIVLLWIGGFLLRLRAGGCWSAQHSLWHFCCSRFLSPPACSTQECRS